MTTYGWVESLEAYCFTAVVGLDRDEVVRRLGAEGATASARTFDECFWAANGGQWVQVGPVDGGVLIAEHNGWQAEESVEGLSKDARVACFYRNVHAVMHFVYAEDGDVVAEFDPLLESRPASGARPWVISGALDGLPFGLFGAESSALTLVERLTGVRITRAWLDGRRSAVRLPALR
jgi:hypothetical protein